MLAYALESQAKPECVFVALATGVDGVDRWKWDSRLTCEAFAELNNGNQECCSWKVFANMPQIMFLVLIRLSLIWCLFMLMLGVQYVALLVLDTGQLLASHTGLVFAADGSSSLLKTGMQLDDGIFVILCHCCYSLRRDEEETASAKEVERVGILKSVCATITSCTKWVWLVLVYCHGELRLGLPASATMVHSDPHATV